MHTFQYIPCGSSRQMHRSRNTEFILPVDQFTRVGARNPDSLGILGQETLIRGFRDTVGNYVRCNVCCFLPQSFCQVRGLKRIWIVKQGTIHRLVTDRLGEEQGGRVASGRSHPMSFLFCTQTPAESVLHQVSSPDPVAFYSLICVHKQNLFLLLLCSPRGENRTVVLVDLKSLSQ